MIISFVALSKGIKSYLARYGKTEWGYLSDGEELVRYEEYHNILGKDLEDDIVVPETRS